MGYALRAVRLLSIVVWVGGLTFFASIEAPTAFHVMGTTKQFALLIAGSVNNLNLSGLAAGWVFLFATALLLRRSGPRMRKLIWSEGLLVIAMIMSTVYVDEHVVPAMDRDRTAAGGDITSLSADSPVRAHFDALHVASERFEGAALLLGIAVVLMMAAEDSRRDPAPVPTR